MFVYSSASQDHGQSVTHNQGPILFNRNAWRMLFKNKNLSLSSINKLSRNESVLHFLAIAPLFQLWKLVTYSVLNNSSTWANPALNWAINHTCDPTRAISHTCGLALATSLQSAETELHQLHTHSPPSHPSASTPLVLCSPHLNFLHVGDTQ